MSHSGEIHMADELANLLHVVCATGFHEQPGGGSVALRDSVLVNLFDDGIFSGAARCGVCGRAWRFSSKSTERSTPGPRRFWFSEVSQSLVTEILECVRDVMGPPSSTVDARMLLSDETHPADGRIDEIYALLDRLWREPSAEIRIVDADRTTMAIASVQRTDHDDSDGM